MQQLLWNIKFTQIYWRKRLFFLVITLAICEYFSSDDREVGRWVDNDGSSLGDGWLTSIQVVLITHCIWANVQIHSFPESILLYAYIYIGRYASCHRRSHCRTQHTASIINKKREEERRIILPHPPWYSTFGREARRWWFRVWSTFGRWQTCMDRHIYPLSILYNYQFLRKDMFQKSQQHDRVWCWGRQWQSCHNWHHHHCHCSHTKWWTHLSRSYRHLFLWKGVISLFYLCKREREKRKTYQ